MIKHSTTIRLDQILYKEATKNAKRLGLSFSDVVHLLLTAFVKGTVRIGVSQYPALTENGMTRAEENKILKEAKKG